MFVEGKFRIRVEVSSPFCQPVVQGLVHICRPMVETIA